MMIKTIGEGEKTWNLRIVFLMHPKHNLSMYFTRSNNWNTVWYGRFHKSTTARMIRTIYIRSTPSLCCNTVIHEFTVLVFLSHWSTCSLKRRERSKIIMFCVIGGRFIHRRQSDGLLERNVYLLDRSLSYNLTRGYVSILDSRSISFSYFHCRSVHKMWEVSSVADNISILNEINQHDCSRERLMNMSAR